MLMSSIVADDGDDAKSHPPTLGARRGAATMTVLGFSRTTDYRHDSIPAAHALLAGLCAARGTPYVPTEDPTDLERLAGIDAVVFVHASGDVLTAAARRELSDRVRGGTGFVGLHAAATAEPSWPAYRDLIGARFRSHPERRPTPVELRVTPDHPATRGLPTRWRWADEWYAFDENPRARRDILLTVDERQYGPEGADAMGDDHPLAWAGTLGAGRTWYTALGHDAAAYGDPVFVAHLDAGLGFVLPPWG